MAEPRVPPGELLFFASDRTGFAAWLEAGTNQVFSSRDFRPGTLLSPFQTPIDGSGPSARGIS